MFDPKHLAKLAMGGKPEEGAEDPAGPPEAPPAPGLAMHALAEDALAAFKAGSASELARVFSDLRDLVQAPNEPEEQPETD